MELYGLSCVGLVVSLTINFCYQKVQMKKKKTSPCNFQKDMD